MIAEENAHPKVNNSWSLGALDIFVGCGTPSTPREGKVCANVANTADVRPKLAGRLIIQLTTGTIDEVKKHAKFAAECGVELVEGAILCFPEQIGTEGASIVVAGPKGVVDSASSTLRTMSPSLTHLGEDYTAHVVLGRAGISSALGYLIGTINGAAKCEFGVPGAGGKNADPIRSEALRLVNAINSGETKDTQAALATWGEGQSALLEVAQGLGTETAFQSGIKEMFDKSINLELGRRRLSRSLAAI